MNTLSILLLIALAAVSVAQDQPTYEDAAAQYGIKPLNAGHDLYLRIVYKMNVKRIRANNANPKMGHKEEVNMFAFWTEDEFFKTMLGTKDPDRSKSVPTVSLVVGWNILTSVDWSTTAVVTPVKNQGGCGSCWAFSAVAALESLNSLAYNVNGSNFSEQQLVSCAKASPYTNYGCSGGWMNNAFNYVIALGITTENAFPYTATNGTCTISGGAFKISSYTKVTATCDAVATAVQYRPLSVAVDASKWSGYKSGTFKYCNTSRNHGVLLVGVTNSTWKIKNSWGIYWGQLGYMTLSAVNGNSTCGICGVVSYPNK